MSLRTFPEATSSLEALIAAMFSLDADGRLVGRAPCLHIVRTTEHVICKTHADLPDDVHESLTAICRKPRGRPREWSEQYATYVNILTKFATVASVRSGSLFTVPIAGAAAVSCAVKITTSKAHLLVPELSEWLPDLPSGRPMMAAVEEGRAVAICASVCSSGEAHCAGVETAPAYRLRGHARTVVQAWATCVRGLGAMPFYATTFDNVASQTLARSLAMPLIGSEFSVYCNRER